MLVFSPVTFCNSWCFVGAVKKKKSEDFVLASYICMCVQVNKILHASLAVKKFWVFKFGQIFVFFMAIHCLLSAHLHVVEKHLELYRSNLDRISIFFFPPVYWKCSCYATCMSAIGILGWNCHIFLPNSHHAVADSLLTGCQGIHEITTLNGKTWTAHSGSACLWSSSPDQGTAISKNAIFVLNAPSQEGTLRRAESAHSGWSHGVSPAALGTRTVSAAQGIRSGLCSSGITTTSLVNKPVEFSLLSHLLADKTTLIALVTSCCKCPSCDERVSHCCLTWLQAMCIFRKKAISSSGGSGLKKKIAFYVTVVKDWV